MIRGYWFFCIESIKNIMRYEKNWDKFNKKKFKYCKLKNIIVIL